jgi:hypothetical protein
MVSDGSRKRDDRKYSRVYHEAVDDPKFAEVWDSDARLALWLRLLVMADAAWPASAALPRSTKRAPLAALVACGLVDLKPGDHFRIHGLDPERQRRSEAASHAATVRWDADRSADSNATGNADVMPRRAEKRKEETNSTQGVAVSIARDDDPDGRKALLEAYRRQGLPVDVT